MIGLSANFTVELNLFCDHEITDENEVLEVKSTIKALSDDIATAIYERYARTDLDGVLVELNAIEYLEPSDLEDFLEVVDIPDDDDEIF